MSRRRVVHKKEPTKNEDRCFTTQLRRHRYHSSSVCDDLVDLHACWCSALNSAGQYAESSSTASIADREINAPNGRMSYNLLDNFRSARKDGDHPFRDCRNESTMSTRRKHVNAHHLRKQGHLPTLGRTEGRASLHFS